MTARFPRVHPFKVNVEAQAIKQAQQDLQPNTSTYEDFVTRSGSLR